MIRLFLRVWLLVFIPLLFLLFSNSYNPMKSINLWLLKDPIKDTFRGSLYLVERKLQQWPQSQWQNNFSELASQFGHEIALIDIGATTDAPKPLSQIEPDGYLIFSDSYDSDVIIKRIGDSNWFLHFMLEESENQETLNQAKGPMNLALQYFKPDQQEQWPDILAELQTGFGFELSLVPLQQLGLPQIKLDQFHKIGRTWTTDDNNITMVYQRLPDSEQVLVAGPVSPAKELTVLVAVVAILIGGISAGILLFVTPLWRDLSRLTRTAARFGEGYLDQRAGLGRFSAINPLARSFNQMADRIEKMVRSQRELTNAIAHDLRTPLSRLDFAFEMLQSREITEEEKQRYERSIASGIDTLDHLIQQLLTLSRYSRTADIIHFDHVDLAARLREEINQQQIEHHHIVFEFNVSPELVDEQIFIDQRAMIRAFNNLLSNAVRYAVATIRIQLGKNESAYYLSVEDDGPGIPDELKEKVFQPFKQLENEERTISKEHGLGLAIVKQIAGWHGGEATLENSYLGGARFTLYWPVRSPLKHST